MQRVLLADDHALVRAGIKALINVLPGYQVVGEVADGRAALDWLRTHGADLVVMDVGMPGLNGLDATAQIRAQWPDCRVVMVSMHAAPQYVAQAQRVGAQAYVLKDAAPEELAAALAAVAAGRSYWSQTLPAPPTRRPADEAEVSLTRRQREILQLIAEGWSTRNIAERLCISVKTVETHRAQLMQRLEIFDVAGLTRHAIRIGLVDPAR